MQPLPAELIALLQQQMTIERNAQAVYQSLEYKLLAMDYCGMSKFMHEQAQEERHHAKRIAYYLIDRGVDPQVEMVAPANAPGNTPLEFFMMAKAFEEKITDMIDSLFVAADTLEDPVTRVFLKHCVKDQAEEETELDQILAWLKQAGNDAAALLILDKKIKKLA